MLCDVNLPDLDGLELARRLRRLHPQVRVVIVTLHMDDERILAALRAGAAGFLTKDAAGAELVTLIRRVGAGEYPINELVLDRAGVATRLLDQFRGLSERAEAAADQEVFSPLTPRELGVLDAAAHGQSNKEIARAPRDQRPDRQEPHHRHPPQARRQRPHPGGDPGPPARLAQAGAGRRLRGFSPGLGELPGIVGERPAPHRLRGWRGCGGLRHLADRPVGARHAGAGNTASHAQA